VDRLGQRVVSVSRGVSAESSSEIDGASCCRAAARHIRAWLEDQAQEFRIIKRLANTLRQDQKRQLA
jgi:hypothetical protein